MAMGWMRAQTTHWIPWQYATFWMKNYLFGSGGVGCDYDMHKNSYMANALLLPPVAYKDLCIQCVCVCVKLGAHYTMFKADLGRISSREDVPVEPRYRLTCEWKMHIFLNAIPVGMVQTCQISWTCFLFQLVCTLSAGVWKTPLGRA